MKDDFCKRIIMESPVGYACHQAIFNDSGVPVDSVFLEVNKAFESLTGLKAEDVLGKKATDIFPYITKEAFTWVRICGDVTMTGIPKEFEQYSVSLEKWYRIKVHSLEKGFFGTYFFDITDEKYLAESVEMFIQQPSEKINYHKIAETMLKISDSKYVIFNFYDESIKKYITKSFAGMENIDKLKDILGFDITGSKWDDIFTISKKETILIGNTIIKFESLSDYAKDKLSEETVMKITDAFNLGKIYMIRIVKDLRIVGDFTLFFESGKLLQHYGTVELYSKMTALFILKKKAEAEIIKSHEQYTLAIKGNRDGIWDWDIIEGKLFLSERWKEIIGYTDSEIKNEFNSFRNHLHPEDRPRIMKYIDSYLKGEIKQYDIEYRMRHKNGTYRWINGRGEALRNDQGVPYRMAGSHTDITEKKEMEKKLEALASIDDLTGMWNRRYFFEMGKIEFSRAKRYKASFTLLMIDVDHFKKVNDTYGHAAGDEVLKGISAIIRKNLRDADIPARIGGEEFAVLFPNTEIDGAFIVAERLRIAVQEFSAIYNGVKIKASISLGLADYIYSESLDGLLKNADTALYKAKEAGRNVVIIFETSFKTTETSSGI